MNTHTPEQDPRARKGEAVAKVIVGLVVTAGVALSGWAEFLEWRHDRWQAAFMTHYGAVMKEKRIDMVLRWPNAMDVYERFPEDHLFPGTPATRGQSTQRVARVSEPGSEEAMIRSAWQSAEKDAWAQSLDAVPLSWPLTMDKREPYIKSAEHRAN
ncbi:hypothetical protein KSF73_10730 [Burkholderiaceae bacterium DAT-1]|nr:hypothetical protein [Burkholderiaceae bacterium DAT-1]